MINFIFLLPVVIFSHEFKNNFIKNTNYEFLKFEIILKDSILNKNDLRINYHFEVQNCSKKTILFYPLLVDIEEYQNEIIALDNCIINDRGEKIFFDSPYDIMKNKIKIKGNKKYISSSETMDLSKQCWSSDSDSSYNDYKIRIKYFDILEKKYIYSDFKNLIVEKDK